MVMYSLTYFQSGTLSNVVVYRNKAYLSQIIILSYLKLLSQLEPTLARSDPWMVVLKYARLVRTPSSMTTNTKNLKLNNLASFKAKIYCEDIIRRWSSVKHLNEMYNSHHQMKVLQVCAGSGEPLAFERYILFDQKTKHSFYKTQNHFIVKTSSLNWYPLLSAFGMIQSD